MKTLKVEINSEVFRITAASPEVKRSDTKPSGNHKDILISLAVK